jgi:AcrR family transcriptional regulator
MRTGGEETKKKILAVAEELFSEKGFDGTSVGINKGLIYYHFKNKNDIMISLFLNVIEELSEYLEKNSTRSGGSSLSIDTKEKIRQEIRFLEKRKRILSVIVMEALKSEDKENFLLKCAQMHLNHEIEEIGGMERPMATGFSDEHEFLVYEFFTGFVPIIFFVVMKEKWCRFYGCDGDRLLDQFLDSFERTHLAAHMMRTRR